MRLQAQHSGSKRRACAQGCRYWHAASGLRSCSRPSLASPLRPAYSLAWHTPSLCKQGQHLECQGGHFAMLKNTWLWPVQRTSRPAPQPHTVTARASAQMRSLVAAFRKQAHAACLYPHAQVGGCQEDLSELDLRAAARLQNTSQRLCASVQANSLSGAAAAPSGLPAPPRPRPSQCWCDPTAAGG